ncbi:ABC transporter permease subunit [Mesobacillus foraminis]|uniref:ABC transporter permease subunit n=1 Tax=Mesobacillus foraminis TaxID=279826 RepID=UPI0039A39927
MNMFLHELRAYRKSTLVWSISLMSLVVLFLLLFPSFSRDAEEFMQVLEGFPEELKRAVGLSIETLATLLGFFSYAFLYIKLGGAIQAMNLGISIVSKETREKTADFLLTKPVTRSQVFFSKLFAALTSLFLTNIVFFFTVFAMSSWVNTESNNEKTLFLICATLFFLQVIFLALGILTGIIFPGIKSVIAVSLGSVFTFFILGMISSSTEDKGLRYLTPFNYFDNQYIIKNLSYEAPFVWTGMFIVFGAIAAGMAIYQRRDVHAG